MEFLKEVDQSEMVYGLQSRFGKDYLVEHTKPFSGEIHWRAFSYVIKNSW